ncbi:YggS family pyridoxal phosphate-dependent enzyme [Ferrimonas lipolytica]|uniref:Pyridoxal phosphate homeostasis protein n=1 Tax=Ferrimonas lipolytica TaxID=2724191 RepID=A0A6H1U9L9_9GAMM|nr:YggS family pyridoxal phosphate-dependent enzyme [Ferrimonas lipolytica]QIZ75724.1 YggS family pyridoxal phosphate-dependent enzyme [Ferrimonas lipolytica]
MATLAERLVEAHNRINNAAAIANRSPEEITLLAVSKTKPASMIVEAYDAGCRHFGENYLQEGVEKIAELSQLDDIVWHFIGPLQSNKTRPVAEHFDWMHTLDRSKIAQRLNDQRPTGKPPLNVCLQVNISNEASKSGVSVAKLPQLAVAVAAMPNLRLRGLMAIPAASNDPAQQRLAFAQMKQLLQQLQQTHPQLDTLSMGMSTDMDAAILEGSTMVRIGTAIFGTRN